MSTISFSFVRALATMVALGAVSALAPSVDVAAGQCWQPPVVGEVADPFRAPPCVWCAGNRGIDFALDGEVAVRAAATGRVVFAGGVARVGYVVVELANQWRQTYGQLTSRRVDRGDVVIAGELIGTATDQFFFGLRVGDDYQDPARYLEAAGGRRRLIPADGSPGRVRRTPSTRCQVAAVGR